MKAKDSHCLEAVVGLRGLCEGDENVLHVNDLPGVTFNRFADVATSEDVSGKETFQRLRRVAALQVVEDFKSHLKSRKRVNIVSEVSHYESGGFHKDDFYPVNDLYVGKEFYSPAGGQPVRQRLDWIEIKTKEATNKTIYITADGATYHKQKVILQAGVNRIPIGIIGDVIRVYVSICDLQLAKQNGSLCGCHLHRGNCSCTGSCGYEKSIESTDGESFVNGSIDPFRFRVSCVCDPDSIICNYAEVLAQPMWYKLGVLLMEEVIYSDSKSFLIRNGKKNAERWLASVMGTEDPETGFKNKSKYWKSIANATNQVIESLKSSPCVDCRGLSIETSLP
ncbi:MAG: hypothetical protein ACWA44_02465 [Thiotrichales bacterium]